MVNDWAWQRGSCVKATNLLGIQSQKLRANKIKVVCGGTRLKYAIQLQISNNQTQSLASQCVGVGGDFENQPKNC